MGPPLWTDRSRCIILTPKSVLLFTSHDKVDCGHRHAAGWPAIRNCCRLCLEFLADMEPIAGVSRQALEKADQHRRARNAREARSRGAGCGRWGWEAGHHGFLAAIALIRG